MALFKKRQEHKFCPVCGTPLRTSDAYCIRCGYSFQARHKGTKGIKWRNVGIIVLLLIVAYFGLRYANDLTIFPRSLQDALTFKYN